MKVSKELETKVLALAGGEPVRARAKGRPKLAAGWAVELTLPCVVRSEANQRCHWAVRKRRFDVQRMTLVAVVREACLDAWLVCRVPVVVTWVHVGRRMDGDNLQGAFKGLRDGLALMFELDDGDPRIEWRYDQRKGTPGVRVRIEGV